MGGSSQRSLALLFCLVSVCLLRGGGSCFLKGFDMSIKTCRPELGSLFNYYTDLSYINSIYYHRTCTELRPVWRFIDKSKVYNVHWFS
jgi:hypothetical protein